MPVGVSWGQYLRFTTAAMLSMFAGSQIVHIYYRPLEDMDELIKQELLKLESEGSKSKEDNIIRRLEELQIKN